MSDYQWAGMMLGDESYSGSRNYFHLKETVEEIFGYPYVIPTHQGRGAEQVLFPILVKKGQYVLSNWHFDTTRAHVDLAQGKAIDVVTKEALDTTTPYDFKGNFDLEKLEATIRDKGPENIGMIICTITNDSAGGQPVSMENIRGASEIAQKHGIPLIMDAARYAENAYFIKQREPGYENKSIREIVREMFSYADAFTMSAKKDGLVNIGGLLAFNRDRKELYEQARSMVVPYELPPTAGWRAGIWRPWHGGSRKGSMRNSSNPASTRWSIWDNGCWTAEFQSTPTGGHAVFVDAGRLLPHIPPTSFRGRCWPMNCTWKAVCAASKSVLS